MNTIYFANLKTGHRAAVKVGQPSYTTLIGAHIGQRKSKPGRRLTVAEAEDAMRRKGYVRWPRKKPLPTELKKAA